MQTVFTILLVVCGIFLVITFIVGIDGGFIYILDPEIDSQSEAVAISRASFIGRWRYILSTSEIGEDIVAFEV